MIPYFSIVLLTYRRPALLKELLLSLAAQTFKDFEVVVADNGGEVPSYDVIAPFRSKFVEYQILYLVFILKKLGFPSHI